MPCNQSATQSLAKSSSRGSLARSASFVLAASGSASVKAPSQGLARTPSFVQTRTSNATPSRSVAKTATHVSSGSLARSASFSKAASSQKAANYSSQVEQALLNAQSPVPFSETAQTSANGQSGIFLNKSEVDNFRGSKPISSYQLNQDSNPLVIRKQSKNVEHVQNVNVRFLKPQAGKAGPIVIRQEQDKLTPPAPPVIIRQQPAKPDTPAPQVYREAPPKVTNLACKLVTLKGKTLPPPPRKVIIEKMAQEPAKPAKVCVDRWLAPEPVKRRVIFKPAAPVRQEKPVNVVIEWSPIKACVRQQVNIRGVTEQNTEEYARQHGSQLVNASSLPQFARNVQAPGGARLAADAGDQNLVELEGDVHALALVDLEAEGLGEYRQFVESQAHAAASKVSSHQTLARSSSGCGARPASKQSSCAC